MELCRHQKCLRQYVWYRTKYLCVSLRDMKCSSWMRFPSSIAS